jgi:endonuclease YncB( thermonuclease family)
MPLKEAARQIRRAASMGGDHLTMKEPSCVGVSQSVVDPRVRTGRYSTAQDEARQNERGIWAGGFVKPWRFRECVRAGVRA